MSFMTLVYLTQNLVQYTWLTNGYLMVKWSGSKPAHWWDTKVDLLEWSSAIPVSACSWCFGGFPFCLWNLQCYNYLLFCSGLRGNMLTGTLSPDMCQLTGLWYLYVLCYKLSIRNALLSVWCYVYSDIRSFIISVMCGAITSVE